MDSSLNVSACVCCRFFLCLVCVCSPFSAIFCPLRILGLLTIALEETEFDMGRELAGLIDMFSVQCINHNVETILDLSDDMPKIVRGDSGRVLQIFANLISNSIKFTTSGYIVLRE
ncbi:hypothetical protein ABFS82_01G112200 [Erythranthe guttata]